MLFLSFYDLFVPSSCQTLPVVFGAAGCIESLHFPAKWVSSVSDIGNLLLLSDDDNLSNRFQPNDDGGDDAAKTTHNPKTALADVNGSRFYDTLMTFDCLRIFSLRSSCRHTTLMLFRKTLPPPKGRESFECRTTVVGNKYGRYKSRYWI